MAAADALPAADGPRFGRRASGPPGSLPGGNPAAVYADNPLKKSGLPQSCPGWRLPSKQRTMHDRAAAARSELRNGFGQFYNTQPPPVAAGGQQGADSFAATVGKKTYTARRGEEAGWRLSVKMVAEVKQVEKASGKAFGYRVPGVSGGEVQPQHRVHFPEQRCTKEGKLLQGRTHPVDPSTGEPLQSRRSKEASHESLMTRKAVTHSHGQTRNGLPLATLGDKPYADPTYSSGYWRSAAPTVPKCGVEQIDCRPPPPNLPQLREAELQLQAERADVAAVPVLPPGAPRYEVRVGLPRKELDDLAKTLDASWAGPRLLNCDGGEVTILRPPSDAAAAAFDKRGLAWRRGGDGGVNDFPISLLRINGEDVRCEESVHAALKGAPAGEVEIHCGHETGDAGLDSP